MNGEPREVISARYVAPGGPLYLAEADLAEWGVAPAKVPLQSLAGARWLCAESVVDGYKLDPRALTLEIDFPPELYGGTAGAYVYDDRVPVTFSRGGFLNYDARAERNAGVGSLGVSWEAGAFARPGLFTSSFISRDDGSHTTRLETALRRDDPQRITSAVAGDTITRPGNYGAAVRIGGLQYRRNFATVPLLITYPSAQIQGTAVVPSTVDVFIGNARTYSAPVKPGPFSVSNLPVPVGAGNVRVVVRDVFGKETATVVPYVRYDELLREGLHDFSYEAGWLRRDYSVDSNNYGDFAAVGTHRYGVGDHLTLEGRSELMNDRGNAGGVVQFTVPVLGLLGVGGALSYGAGAGTLGKAFFQRRERDWTAAASAEERSADYRDIAFEPNQVRTLSVRQISASARVTPRNWVNVLGLKTRDTLGTLDTATVGWTRSLPYSATLSANLSRFSGDVTPANTVLSVILAVPFGTRDYGTLSVERSSDAASPDRLVGLSRNLLETDSFGYRVLAGRSSGAERLELGAFWQTRVGQYGIEAANAFDTESARAYARGGLAAAGGAWKLSRYLDESFAIVKVADFPGVRVFANKQPVTSTDHEGTAVIPRVPGFLASELAFEPEDVPLDGTFKENVRRVKIASRMGVLVDMGVRRELSATLTLQEPDARPVPAGASARLAGRTEEFAVARGGRVYVSGLERGKTLTLEVAIGSRGCSAAIEIPADFATGGMLGPFTCR